MKLLVSVLAASDDTSIVHDLGEVVVYGALAGVGLSIAFALMLRGIIGFGAARREGRTLHLAGHGTLAVVFGAACLGAVVLAFATMLAK
jgi:hypothetical protein